VASTKVVEATSEACPSGVDGIEAEAVEAAPEDAPPEPPDRPASSLARGRWKRFAWAGAAAAVVVLLMLSVWHRGDGTGSADPSAPTSEPSFELEAVSAQTASEGSEFTLRLRVRTTGASEARPVFVLIGRPPEGAEIDQSTGEFTWTPTEEQGPGEHAVRVRVTANDAKGSTAETTFRVEVEEVNTPPAIRPIDEKTIDAGQELTFSVTVDDPDRPPNRPTFRLSDGPDWIRVEPTSGVVRCAAPETADGRFEATIQVSDDGEPPLEDETVVGLVVRGDPWARVEKEFREALFLVEVELGKYSWPYATCCAIGDHTLLTSADVGIDLADLHRRGYRIWAVGPATNFRTAVRTFCVPLAIAELSEPGDWFHANLGVLATEEALPKRVQLASPDELRDLEEGLPVACFGFPHDGAKITRFDTFEPRLTPTEVYLTGGSPRLSGDFQLLELKGKIPENVYGSPILNRRGKVIAVYGKAAPDEGVAVKDLHYAAVLNTRLLQSWLDGTDIGAWITPRLSEAASSQQSPPQTQPN
jgi:hypothetical protein